MRAYKITLNGKTRYAGTGAQSKETRDTMLNDAGLGPRDKSVKTEDIDIPTSKNELLEFINELSAAADPAE